MDRETDIVFTVDSQQQPPTNLLIELTENLDPFHVH